MKVLFIPVDAVGHTRAAIGIAQVLIEHGHRVLFLVNDQWRGRLEEYGIEEVLFKKLDNREGSEDPALRCAQQITDEGFLTPESPLQKMIKIYTTSIRESIGQVWDLNAIVERTFNTTAPDLIVLDQYLCLPAVELSGIPWVWTCSCNPLLVIEDEMAPPQGSGLSINSDKNEWKLFRDSVKKSTFDIWKQFNASVVSKGVKPLPECQYFHRSPHLNIYQYPAALDYTDSRPLPHHYQRFDTFKIAEKDTTFEIPPEFRCRTAEKKLIYFSMGSMCAADIPMMERLVAILGQSQHRFLVSQGPHHHSYLLAENMWGRPVLPQTTVLPLVDLVISHGGNNTVTECVYYGKAVIVLPLFGDQYDNAQQIEDRGFGVRLDPYRCAAEELLQAIERLLNDKPLNEKLSNISKAIQTENRIQKLPKIFESLVQKK